MDFTSPGVSYCKELAEWALVFSVSINRQSPPLPFLALKSEAYIFMKSAAFV